MKPSLAYMVSGIFALLVGLTFTFTSTSARGSRPDGYADNGLAYYYAYPDEGYVDEGNGDESDIAPAETPPDSSLAPSDAYNYGYDDSYVEPYYGYGGWWSWGGPGVPFGQHNIFNREPRLGNGSMHRDGMHHNFPMHSPMVTPHRNVARAGKVGSGRMTMGGAPHVGGSHR